MKKTTIILITLIAFGLIALFAALFERGTLILNENQTVEPINDPIDVTSTLVNNWLDNVTATTSLPLAAFLQTQADITDELQTTLVNAESSSDRDVILCQVAQPVRVGVKPIYVDSRSAQMAILARGGEKTPDQAIVDLTLVEDTWQITNISCSRGDVGPELGEFSFQQTGRLVKESVPAPYDNSTWHLIFSQPDTTVQVVQLLFDDASQCLGESGSTTCNPATLTEGAAAFVQADLTEAGALVRQMDTE